MLDNVSGWWIKVIVVEAHALNSKNKSKSINEIKINAATSEYISTFAIQESVNLMVTIVRLLFKAFAI